MNEQTQSAEFDAPRPEDFYGVQGVQPSDIARAQSSAPTNAQRDPLLRLAALLEKEPWHRKVGPERLALLIREACVIPPGETA